MQQRLIELLPTHGILHIGTSEYLFDLEDLHLIQSRNWYPDKDGYLVCGYYYFGRYQVSRFHRIVMHAKPGEIVDHIDKNRKDNRKRNLRRSAFTENDRMLDVSQWISVQEKLPPPDHRVLVTTASPDPARGLVPRKECCEAIAIYQDGTVDRYESDWWWDASQCDFDDEAVRATVSPGWYEYILNQPIPIGGDNLICPEFYDPVTHWMPLPQVPGRKEEYYV